MALQYEVKYDSDGSSKLTLNSKEEENWGQVLQLKGFEGPGPGRPFDLLVARKQEGFLCFLDGIEQGILPYRLEDQVPNHVTLTGDLETYRLFLLWSCQNFEYFRLVYYMVWLFIYNDVVFHFTFIITATGNCIHLIFISWFINNIPFGRIESLRIVCKKKKKKMKNSSHHILNWS